MPNIPANGVVSPATVFVDNMHLIEELFAYSNLCDIASFAASSACNATLARLYLEQRLKEFTVPFFANSNTLFEILCCCDAVISGSTALHFLLAKSTPWLPTDLDIYVPRCHAHHLVTLLNNQGYQLVHQGIIDNSPYSHSQIHTILNLSNGTCRLDIVVSQKNAGLPPIFHFHSMAVMNFILPDRIFCAYPALTFRGLSMVNLGPLYVGHHGRNTFNALRKYEEQGFRYITCADAHQYNITCKASPRTLTDGRGMWVDIKRLPRVSVSSKENFVCFGCMDVCWVLGGMVCDTKCALVTPQISVIEDAL